MVNHYQKTRLPNAALVLKPTIYLQLKKKAASCYNSLFISFLDLSIYEI